MENKEKRYRSSKWSAFEKSILKQLVDSKFSIIENNSNDVKTSIMKKEAWIEICKCFNTICAVRPYPMEIHQLKAKWHTLKNPNASSDYKKSIDLSVGWLPPSSHDTQDKSQICLSTDKLDEIQENKQASKNVIQNRYFPTDSFKKPGSSPIINNPVYGRQEANILCDIYGCLPEGIANKFVYKTPNRSSEIRSSLQSDSFSPRKNIVPKHKRRRSLTEKSEQKTEIAQQIKNFKEQTLKTRSPTKTLNETVVKPTKQISASDSGNFNAPSSDTSTATLLPSNNSLEIPTIDLTNDNESESVPSYKSEALSQISNGSELTKEKMGEYAPITNIFIKMEKDEEHRRIEEEEYQQQMFRRNSSLIIEEQPTVMPSSNSALNIVEDHRILQSTKDLTSESECNSSENSANISQKNTNVEAEELKKRKRSIERPENQNKKQRKSSIALENIAHSDKIEERRQSYLKEREGKPDSRHRLHLKETKTVTVLSPTVIKITSSTADKQDITTEGSFKSNKLDNNETIKQQTQEQIMPSTNNESAVFSTESFNNSAPTTIHNLQTTRSNEEDINDEIIKLLLSKTSTREQELSPALIEQLKESLLRKTSTRIETAEKNKQVGKSSTLETVQTKDNEEQCSSEAKKGRENQDSRSIVNSTVFVEEQSKEITRRDPSLNNVEEQSNNIKRRDKVRFNSVSYIVEERPKITCRRKTLTGLNSVFIAVEEQPKEIYRRDSSFNVVEEQPIDFTLTRAPEQPNITTRRNTVTGHDSELNRVEEQPKQINGRDSSSIRVEDQSNKINRRSSVLERNEEQPLALIGRDSALKRSEDISKDLTKQDSSLKSVEEQPKIITRRNSVLKILDKQQKTMNEQEFAAEIVEEEPTEITRKESSLSILAERPGRTTEKEQNSEPIQKPKRKYIRKNKAQTVIPDQSQLLVRNLNILGSSSLQKRRSSLFKRNEEQPETLTRLFDAPLKRFEEQPNDLTKQNSSLNRVEDQPKMITRRNSVLKIFEKQSKTMNKQGSSMRKPKEITRRQNIVTERPTQTDNTVLKRPSKYRKSIQNEEQVEKHKKRKYIRKNKVETVTSDQLHLVEPNLNVPASSSPHLHASLQLGLEREIMARQINVSETNLLSEIQNKRPRQEKSTQGSNLDRNEEQKRKNARRLAAKTYGKVLLIRKKRRRCSNKNDTETVTTEESHLILPTLNAPGPSIDSIRLAQCPECIGSTRTLNTTDGTTPDFFALYETVRKLKLYIFKVQSLGMKQMSFIGSQVNEPQSLFYNSFERVDNLLINKYRERLHVYDATKFQDNKPFFGLYSQSCRPHLCDTSKISIIRKSEFHSKVNNIKQHPKKKKKLKQTVNVIIYSFEDDLYLDLPQNDFWTKPNVTLRLKKSINNNFNFIYASRIALADVKIYGTYFVEYVYMGRALEGEWEINYDSKPFPIDCGFLHYGDGNNKSGDEMDCACNIVDKSYSFKMPKMRS